jgi:hypothetical protein
MMATSITQIRDVIMPRAKTASARVRGLDLHEREKGADIEDEHEGQPYEHEDPDGPHHEFLWKAQNRSLQEASSPAETRRSHWLHQALRSGRE